MTIVKEKPAGNQSKVKVFLIEIPPFIPIFSFLSQNMPTKIPFPTNSLLFFLNTYMERKLKKTKKKKGNHQSKIGVSDKDLTPTPKPCLH